MKAKPLAFKMAPRELKDLYGQEHILGEGKLLSRMIQADKLSSIILFGPPGTGKTSIARVIANTTKLKFRKVNAVTAGIKDLKAVIDEAGSPILCPEGRLILFVDEIHRFNKAQQDALLPAVEAGTVILIGASTENPYFEVNKALISRSTVFALKPLSKESLKALILNALNDEERGLGKIKIELDDLALNNLASLCQGDARAALNALELAVLSNKKNEDGKIVIDTQTVLDCVQKRLAHYDKNGEMHYDVISAFIKSMRGSDPDATLHYLARLIVSGEDINFIARRMVICAAEDVGLANPQVLNIATSALLAIKQIGLPEARIILAEAALAIALSPKSNSAYLAIDAAIADIEQGLGKEVPLQLRNSPHRAMKELGYSQGYQYPHNYPRNYQRQEYLPSELKDKVYYQVGKEGYEQNIAKFLQNLDQKRFDRNIKGENNE